MLESEERTWMLSHATKIQQLVVSLSYTAFLSGLLLVMSAEMLRLLGVALSDASQRQAALFLSFSALVGAFFIPLLRTEMARWSFEIAIRHASWVIWFLIGGGAFWCWMAIARENVDWILAVSNYCVWLAVCWGHFTADDKGRPPGTSCDLLPTGSRS